MYVYTYTCIKPCLSTPSFLSLLISEKHPTLLGVLSDNPPPVFTMPTEEEQEDHKQEQHHEKGGEDQGQEEQQDEEEEEEEEEEEVKGDHVSLLRHSHVFSGVCRNCGRFSRTPSPNWKMPNFPRETPPKSEVPRHRPSSDLRTGITLHGQDVISARKLGAALWKLSGSYYGWQTQQPLLQPHQQCLGRPSSPPNTKASMKGSSSSACHPIMCKINARKHPKSRQSWPFIRCESPTSEHLVRVLHRLCLLEEEHGRVVCSLRSDLKRSRANAHRLRAERKLYRQHIIELKSKLAEEKSMAHIRVQEAVSLAIASLKEDLDNERKSRHKLEGYQKKIVKDMGETRKSLTKVQKDLERERRARELMEDVCEELAKKIGDDKAKVEELKRRCARNRAEAEEEQKMFDSADVWREGKVHKMPSANGMNSAQRSKNALKEIQGSHSRDNSLKTKLLQAKLEAQQGRIRRNYV